MHMKKLYLYTLFITALAVFGAVAAQADRIDADFSNADDADAFVAAAEDRGQGRGAQVTHNEDGTTSVGLPEVAAEMMAETAMDAIAEHANAIAISGCPCFDSTDVDDVVADCRLNGAPTTCQDISFDFFSQLRCDVPLPGTYSASIHVREFVEDDFAQCITQKNGIFESLIMTLEEGQACRAILRDLFGTGACDREDRQ